MLLFLLGLILIQLSWVLSVPPFRGVDEVDHAYRTSSVAEGHLLEPLHLVDRDQGRGYLIPVRRDIASAAYVACHQLPYNGPANCAAPTGSDAGDVLLASAAARYNPVFYLITGTASKPFTGYAAFYAMRIAGCVLSAVLLAASAWALTIRSRTGWPLALFLAALTPTTLFSLTLDAPNGVNMAAGFAVWVALLGLYRGDPPSPAVQRSLLSLGTIGALALMSTHTLGLVWLALILLVMLGLAGPRRVLQRLRETPHAHLTAVVVVGTGIVATAGWILTVNPNDPAGEGFTSTGSPFPHVFGGLILWPLQAIAAFPARDGRADLVVYGLAFAVVLLLSVLGVRRADPRTRWLLGVGVLVAFLVPIGLTVATYAQLGMAWQGRYGAPFVCGLYLMLGYGMDRRPGPSRAGGIRDGRIPERRIPDRRITDRRIIALVVALLVLTNLLGMTGLVRRMRADGVWQHGGHWAAPPALLLIVLSVFAALAWLVAARAAGSTERQPAP